MGTIEDQPIGPLRHRLTAIAGFLWKWHWRIAGYLAGLAILTFLAIVLVLRYWLLPDITDYREDIAQSITRAAGQRVVIGDIRADWSGLRPHLVLKDIQVFDQHDRPVLFLSHVENTLSWWTLFVGDIRFSSLVIDRPSLAIHRDANGLVFVAGIPVNQPGKQSGFVDWMLQQRRIEIKNAVVLWQDDLKSAAPLVLSKVGFVLENHGSRHLFGLQADPPAALAKPLDIRGEVRGNSLNDLGAWRGTLYARVDYADLSALRQWVQYPLDLASGAGGMRVWADFREKQFTAVTADVALVGVKVVLGEGLQQLDLSRLTGRVGWTRLERGEELHLSRLSLATRGGVSVRQMDYRIRHQDGTPKIPAAGEMEANVLPFGPLRALAEYLPLDARTREMLAEIEPKGSIHDLVMNWTGPWDAPVAYRVKGRFVKLGVRPFKLLPGLSGVTGNVDADERGGTLSLNANKTAVEFPRIFRQPLEFDTFTAQANWRIKSGTVDFKLTNASFANQHVAGNTFGSYRTVPGTPGVVDITGNLTRADARFVTRYIPTIVGESAQAWLDKAFLAGKASEVKLRLKGDLADFPFVDGRRGLFQVTAKVADGVLHYADGWTDIDHLRADILFEGKRMEINAQDARILGVSLRNVHAEIPDLLTSDEVLNVEGNALGPTGEYLRYIEQTPVSGMINDFTVGMRADGMGKLALKLKIPLRRSSESRVSGTYQFANNRFFPGEGLPVVDQVSGQISFTDGSIKADRITGQLLGGPVIISAAPQTGGGVRVVARGRLTGAGLMKAADYPLAGGFDGAADWQGTVVIKGQRYEMSFDSSLRGLASNLPAPLDKPAASAMALHIERRLTGPDQDEVVLRYGDLVSAKFLRRSENGQMRVEKGAVTFGGMTANPVQGGIWVNGSLDSVDLDQWRAFLGGGGQENGRPSSGLELAGLNMTTHILDAFGRRFNDLHVNAWRSGDGWKATLDGKEVAGEATWATLGRGRIVARLTHLMIPEASPPKVKAEVVPPSRELPALDVVAEDFETRRGKLGRLEVLATNQIADWKIDRLKLAAPEYVLSMDGTWRGWLSQPQTNTNVKLDVKDVGKFLARFGFPDAVKRGTAKLDGKLSWAGGPSELDYASLSGEFTLEAKNGQFQKIDPGIGKLLGILSLQALPRRITLDFRDIFSEGFAFDSISGSMRIERGVMYSNDFRIDGPSAKIFMSGETNLARETQKLDIKVVPTLGEGVSVAGALLGGPVVGLTTLLVQKVLKDPIGQIAAYEYNVTGSWSDPQVTKVPRQGQSADQ